MAALSQTGIDIVTATQTLPPEEKKEVVDQIVTSNPTLFRSDDWRRNQLWMVLLIGLFALALVAIISTVILKVNDGSNDTTALIAVATAIVAGVIGLFANPPTAK